jgi:menaquinol-cytochrome c reductase iron-sulfur subunit
MERHDNNNRQPSPQELNRRRFLAYLSGLLAGIITLIIAIPIIGFVISPLLRPKKESWVKLGPVSALTPGQPIKFAYSYQLIDGWFEKTAHATAYAVLLAAGTEDIIVLSNICTHLGCGVRWDDTQQKFLCPCHNGSFDIEGKNVAGPPPRPLPKLQWKIDQDMILAKVEEV